MYKDNWRADLKRLPRWVNEALSHFDDSHDYIRYRLAQHADNFKVEVQHDLESQLLGVHFATKQKLSDHEQRVMFFRGLIELADRFRVNQKDDSIAKAGLNSGENNIVPEELKPTPDHPTVRADLKLLKVNTQKINTVAAQLSDLLRTHRIVRNRLPLVPLEIMPIFVKVANGPATEGDNNQKNSLPELDITDLINILDELASVALKNKTQLEESQEFNEHQLGLFSQQTAFDFYSAAKLWIQANSIDANNQPDYDFDGNVIPRTAGLVPTHFEGFIPGNFKLSHSCWASLISSVLYQTLSAHSISNYLLREHDLQAFQDQQKQQNASWN